MLVLSHIVILRPVVQWLSIRHQSYLTTGDLQLYRTCFKLLLMPSEHLLLLHIQSFTQLSEPL